MKGNGNFPRAPLFASRCADINILLLKQQINEITCVHNANDARNYEKKLHENTAARISHVLEE